MLEQAFLRAAQARAQAQVSPQGDLFDIQRVADEAYAAMARPQAILNSNAAIFERAEDLLIVDAHSKPSAAAALVAQIKKEITQKPVRYIVNTHFHWDHTQGDPAYRKLAPQSQIVTSSTTRELLIKFGASRAKESVVSAAASLDGYHHRLETAKTSQERARIQRTMKEIEAYLSQMREYSPELPDVTFDDVLELHDKKHDLQLAFRGRGHTAGDVVVFCPQNKVIATGDLLHGWFPFIGDGYPREWPKTLTSVSEFPFEAVIGGHGGVQRGKKTLGHMSGYIAELAERVDTAKRKGQSRDEVMASITPDQLRSLDAEYRTFLVAQATDKDRTPDQIIAAGVRGNIADIYERIDAS
jgi:glyoxylase-like metal-dependent hydrolase (beta-lactamase superfamily II)